MTTESAVKHTPGPWRIRSHRNLDERDRTKITSVRYSVSAGKQEGPFENKGWFHPEDATFFKDELYVVEVYFDSEFNYEGGGIENEADARLIAAAPTMLKELEVAHFEFVGLAAYLA